MYDASRITSSATTRSIIHYFEHSKNSLVSPKNEISHCWSPNRMFKCSNDTTDGQDMRQLAVRNVTPYVLQNSSVCMPWHSSIRNNISLFTFFVRFDSLLLIFHFLLLLFFFMVPSQFHSSLIVYLKTITITFEGS